MKCYAVLYTIRGSGSVKLTCWTGWTSTEDVQQDLAVSFSLKELHEKHEFSKNGRLEEPFFIHEFDVEIP